MIALVIEDMGDFTKKLLIGEVFDRFLLSKATIVTSTTLTLDGRLNAAYYDNVDAAAPAHVYAQWAQCKPLAYAQIKGRRLPLSFQFILLADTPLIKALCERTNRFTPEDIAGLFLNISYNGSEITCTTGTSLHTFTLDKTADQLWDDAVKHFFTTQRIAFRE